jgi:dATP pyrophosphohydrolase
MARAPFQVLVFPYYRTDADTEYAIFRRTDTGYWQGIAGGGEGEETPLQAAKREAQEEASIPAASRYVTLEALSKVSVVQVAGTLLWGEDVLVIPEYCFGVEAVNRQLALSREHVEYRWVQYDTAVAMLHWDSNKTALWELNHRLLR